MSCTCVRMAQAMNKWRFMLKEVNCSLGPPRRAILVCFSFKVILHNSIVFFGLFSRYNVNLAFNPLSYKNQNHQLIGNLPPVMDPIGRRKARLYLSADGTIRSKVPCREAADQRSHLPRVYLTSCSNSV